MEKNALFKNRLAEAMENVTVTELAAKLDISKQSVSAYLTGVRKPKQLLLTEIARVLCVDPLWLAGYDVPKQAKESRSVGVRVPVYGKVAAGIPIEATNRADAFCATNQHGGAQNADDQTCDHDGLRLTEQSCFGREECVDA